MAPIKSDIALPLCELLVNTKEEVCLLVNGELNFIPQWAEFDAKGHNLYLVFDNGKTFNIDFRIDDSLVNPLSKAKKVFVITLENKKPTNGFEISLIQNY